MPGPSFRLLPRQGASWVNMLVIAAGYSVYALSLLAQPARWSRTPAYHNLLIIFPSEVWGACFAVTAGLLFAAVTSHRRWLSVIAIGAALLVTTGWAGAFVVRWALSDSTTPETWVSWAINDYLLFRAWALLDRPGGDAGPAESGPR